MATVTKEGAPVLVPKKLLIAKREAAAMLSISERTLHDLTKAGIIPSVMLGARGRRYSVEALEQFIQRQLVSSTA